MKSLKKLVDKSGYHNGITAAKKFWYGNTGEPIKYHEHKLRYVPGTRPVRLKYINSPNPVVRNDAKQLEFFLDNIHKGDLVLDVGANLGQYAVLFASLVSDSGKVIAFEPNEASREVLSKNLCLNNFQQRVEVEGVALFDITGSHSFFSRGTDSMSSLARSGFGDNASSADINEHTTATIRLDDYLLSKNLPAPNLIKIDPEGAEISILRGARDVLRSGAKIICELHPYAWEEFDTTYEELLDIVSECGRHIRYLDDSLKIKDGAFYGATIIY